VVRIHTGSAYVRDGVTKWLGDGKEAADNRDLWRQLDAAMAPHDVSWHWLDDHDERAGQLAVDGMRKAVADAVADDGECVHELPIGQCALCKPPPPGVRPRGYRTEAGNAYHNDRDCTWMHRGQQRAERQGKNVRDIVRVVWATVRPGELEPCEYCCTPQWLRQHGC
jgi:hypothetical protein